MHNRQIRSTLCAVSTDPKIVFENKIKKETELVTKASGSTCDETFRSSQSYLNFSVALSLDESAYMRETIKINKRKGVENERRKY